MFIANFVLWNNLVSFCQKMIHTYEGDDTADEDGCDSWKHLFKVVSSVLTYGKITVSGRRLGK